MIKLTVNGVEHRLEVAPDMPLLWALRDHLQLTGTKYGCGIALCGACTVHIDGQAVRSCSVTAASAVGKAITTIEGLAGGDTLHAVQAAWLKRDVAQCGYCQSGQIMTATALLSEQPQPSDADIDAAMAGNVCRCGTYQRIREAIHEAAAALADEVTA
ncbi:MAG: (2Fe-2S)-binding protein [Luminiphilus sp.]|jgi:isoquinoline 1-oxidoreductase alpha subunit